MTTYNFNGNPDGQFSAQQGDQGFDVGTKPNNYFVCNGGNSWFAINVSGGPSGAWAGTVLQSPSVGTNWVVPIATDVLKVLSSIVAASSTENLDPDSIAAVLTKPEARRTFDPQMDDRMAELVSLVVQQFRGAIRDSGQHAISVTPGAVPPEALKHVLKMAAWELVNSTPSLKMVIVTDKGAYAPMGAFYNDAKAYIDLLRKGRPVLEPTDPTGRDYVNPVNVPWSPPYPPYNPALPVNFPWRGCGVSPYGAYDGTKPINVPWTSELPVFVPTMPINKPVRPVRVGAMTRRQDLTTFDSHWNDSEDFPVEAIGQP